MSMSRLFQHLHLFREVSAYSEGLTPQCATYVTFLDRAACFSGDFFLNTLQAFQPVFTPSQVKMMYEDAITYGCPGIMRWLVDTYVDFKPVFQMSVFRFLLNESMRINTEEVMTNYIEQTTVCYVHQSHSMTTRSMRGRTPESRRFQQSYRDSRDELIHLLSYGFHMTSTYQGRAILTLIQKIYGRRTMMLPATI